MRNSNYTVLISYSEVASFSHCSCATISATTSVTTIYISLLVEVAVGEPTGGEDPRHCPTPALLRISGTQCQSHLGLSLTLNLAAPSLKVEASLINGLK
ncbi:hypothetical protein TIFTF001_043704 [Ficus carica]|uniref:Uncharacterized protein n=1 Tax=Ficus carica TaxID=3494 RepID=A0AA87YUU7_FICCA|nr:hypothetical protein TIFTF001_043704 [Ficus carica]